MSVASPDMIFKICVIGDAAVGKSSTVRRWTQGSFTKEYQVTIGVQHYSKNVTVDEPEATSNVKLIVWDLGGQETFRFIRPMFYKAAKGIIIMFDLTRRSSFDSVVNWVREADTGIGQRVPIVIAANKADMDYYEVDPKEALEFAESLGATLVLTSAKEGLNVSDLFTVLASLVVKDISSHLPDGKANTLYSVAP